MDTAELLRQVKAVLAGQTPADTVGWQASQRRDGPPPWWDVELVATNKPGDYGCFVWVMRAGEPPRCRRFAGFSTGGVWVENAVAFFADAVQRPMVTSTIMDRSERT
jgi:hypothetical protein